MATPARTNILLELKSQLEGITVANGYNTEVTAVTETLISRDEVRTIGVPPVISFGAGRETPTHSAFGEIRVEMPVAILGYIEEADWTTRSAALNLFIDDIIARMSSDLTLNSNATSVEFVGWETDEADPDATVGCPDGAGTCLVEIKVIYYRTTSAS